MFDDPDEEERTLYIQYWQGKLKNNDKVSFPDEVSNASGRSTGKDRKGKGRAEDVHDESDVEGETKGTSSICIFPHSYRVLIYARSCAYTSAFGRPV